MRGLLTEAQFTDTIIELAKYRGWKVAHFRPAQMQSGRWATAMKGDIGYPDLSLARRGRVLIVELKTDVGRYGRGQQEWAEALGDHYRLWRPRDIKQIQEELR
jgi:hypothetical protein